MGCAPSRSHILVNSTVPADVAKVTPVTAAGAPLTFNDGPEEMVLEENENKKRSSYETNEDQSAVFNEDNDVFNLTRAFDGKLELDEALTTLSSSARSRDSGVSELDEQYSLIITEESDPVKVLEVEQNFEENQTCVLEIVGKGCPRKLSPKDKERFEEQNILSTLREEGLVPRPASRKNGGLRFEIVSAKVIPGIPDTDYPGLRKLPPLSLQNSMIKKQKKITKEEIEEKLEKAEERRKLKDEEKMNKLTSKPKIEEIMSNIEQQSQEIKEKYNNKMEAKEKCRQNKMKELQGKLRNHQQHVEKVRHRKKLITNLTGSIGTPVTF